MKHIITAIFITCFLFSCHNKEKQILADYNETEKLSIILEEHFNGKTLDTRVWNYELGDGCPNLCGWGNNERQIYTKENVNVQDGKLIITATKNDSIYKSSKMTTKDNIEFQYGTVEARVKLPLGNGLWPAVWMLGSDIDTVGWPKCGEIDIMEYVGKSKHEIHTTLHTPDSYGNSKNTKLTIDETIEDGFHIFKTNWTKEKIDFFIDEKLVYTFNPEIKNDKTWPYNKPFYLILNLAIGGNFGGPEVDDSIFPQEFIIDYIKIYKQ